MVWNKLKIGLENGEMADGHEFAQNVLKRLDGEVAL